MRELSRVAIPTTEAAWRDRALGKNLRQIEELVAGHTRGDEPDDPKDPSVVPRTLELQLAPEVFARLRQVQVVLADEHGGRLDDDALVTALCEAVLGRATPDGEPTGRAKFQILMTVCERCKQGTQEGSGVQVAVDAAAVDRALCDAQHIGSTSDPTPVRASQDIPPAVVRFVWRRDGGRCQTPGAGRPEAWRSITRFRAPTAARTSHRTFTSGARNAPRVTWPRTAGRSSSMGTRCCVRMRGPTGDRRNSTTRSFGRRRAMRSSVSGGSQASRAPQSRKRSRTSAVSPSRG